MAGNSPLPPDSSVLALEFQNHLVSPQNPMQEDNIQSHILSSADFMSTLHACSKLIVLATVEYCMQLLYPVKQISTGSVCCSDQLQKALPSEILSKYEERVTEESISLAQMPGLVRYYMHIACRVGVFDHVCDLCSCTLL